MLFHWTHLRFSDWFVARVSLEAFVICLNYTKQQTKFLFCLQVSSRFLGSPPAALQSRSLSAPSLHVSQLAPAHRRLGQSTAHRGGKGAFPRAASEAKADSKERAPQSGPVHSQGPATLSEEGDGKLRRGAPRAPGESQPSDGGDCILVEVHADIHSPNVETAVAIQRPSSPIPSMNAAETSDRNFFKSQPKPNGNLSMTNETQGEHTTAVPKEPSSSSEKVSGRDANNYLIAGHLPANGTNLSDSAPQSPNHLGLIPEQFTENTESPGNIKHTESGPAEPGADFQLDGSSIGDKASQLHIHKVPNGEVDARKDIYSLDWDLSQTKTEIPANAADLVNPTVGVGISNSIVVAPVDQMLETNLDLVELETGKKLRPEIGHKQSEEIIVSAEMSRDIPATSSDTLSPLSPPTEEEDYGVVRRLNDRYVILVAIYVRLWNRWRVMRASSQVVLSWMQVFCFLFRPDKACFHIPELFVSETLFSTFSGYNTTAVYQSEENLNSLSLPSSSREQNSPHHRDEETYSEDSLDQLDETGDDVAEEIGEGRIHVNSNGHMASESVSDVLEDVTGDSHQPQEVKDTGMPERRVEILDEMSDSDNNLEQLKQFYQKQTELDEQEEDVISVSCDDHLSDDSLEEGSARSQIGHIQKANKKKEPGMNYAYKQNPEETDRLAQSLPATRTHFIEVSQTAKLYSSLDYPEQLLEQEWRPHLPAAKTSAEHSGTSISREQNSSSDSASLQKQPDNFSDKDRKSDAPEDCDVRSSGRSVSSVSCLPDCEKTDLESHALPFQTLESHSTLEKELHVSEPFVSAAAQEKCISFSESGSDNLVRKDVQQHGAGDSVSRKTLIEQEDNHRGDGVPTASTDEKDFVLTNASDAISDGAVKKDISKNDFRGSAHIGAGDADTGDTWHTAERPTSVTVLGEATLNQQLEHETSTGLEDVRSEGTHSTNVAFSSPDVREISTNSVGLKDTNSTLSVYTGSGAEVPPLRLANQDGEEDELPALVPSPRTAGRSPRSCPLSSRSSAGPVSPLSSPLLPRSSAAGPLSPPSSRSLGRSPRYRPSHDDDSTSDESTCHGE